MRPIFLLLFLLILSSLPTQTYAETSLETGLGMASTGIHPTLPSQVFDGIASYGQISLQQGIMSGGIRLSGYIPSKSSPDDNDGNMQTLLISGKISQIMYGEMRIDVEHHIRHLSIEDKETLDDLSTQVNVSKYIFWRTVGKVLGVHQYYHPDRANNFLVGVGLSHDINILNIGLDLDIEWWRKTNTPENILRGKLSKQTKYIEFSVNNIVDSEEIKTWAAMNFRM